MEPTVWAWVQLSLPTPRQTWTFCRGHDESHLRCRGHPVVAIGGIHKENLLRLKGTGVNGVALVSAIFGAEDIEAECRELKALAEQL